MPYKTGKLKGQLTAPEIRKLIKAHNILMSIKIPPGTDREGLIKLVEANKYKVNHEKSALVPISAMKRKPEIPISQANALTKPTPKSALQIQKAQEVKQTKAVQKKKEVREIKKQAIQQQKQIQTKQQPTPKPAVKKETPKPKPKMKVVKTIQQDPSPFIGKQDAPKSIPKPKTKPIPAPPPVSKPSTPVKVSTKKNVVEKDMDFCKNIMKYVNDLINIQKIYNKQKTPAQYKSIIYNIDVGKITSLFIKTPMYPATTLKGDVLKNTYNKINNFYIFKLKFKTQVYSKTFNKLKNLCGEQEAQKYNKLYEEYLRNDKNIFDINKALPKKDKEVVVNKLTGKAKVKIDIQKDPDYLKDLEVMSIGDAFKDTIDGKSIDGVYPWVSRRDEINLLEFGWILKQSKNDCSVPWSVLRETRLYEPSGNDFKKGWWFNTNKMVEGDNPKQIAKAIIDCAKRKKMVALPLSAVNKGKSAHANMLIWNYHLNSLERYEPHGDNWQFGKNAYEKEWGIPKVNDLVNAELKKQGSSFQFKYYSPNDVCPRPALYKEFKKITNSLFTGKNLQSWETSNIKGSKNFEGVFIEDPSGYCGAFSFLYLWTRLRNPLVEPSKLLAEQLKWITRDSPDKDSLSRGGGQANKDIITQMIRGFTKTIFDALIDMTKENVLSRGQAVNFLEDRTTLSGFTKDKLRDKVMDYFKDMR